jgi:2-polyprenyl-6-methoxyphenol hydroxylase-like FAD-dependent oxidoreductase
MSESWDVIILGGGPGGSTLASCLAQRGLRTIVLERERFPRFHIGESLLPRSREIFQKLGASLARASSARRPVA